MVSSRWQKQNSNLLFTGPAIVLAAYVSVGWFIWSLGLERNWLTLLLVIVATAAAVMVAYSLRRIGANSMTRVLKVEHQSAVHALRRVLKEKSIPYHRENWDKS